MTVLDISVAVGADDGEAYGTTFKAAETLNICGFTSSEILNWYRFQSVAIPQGTTISSAYLEVVAGAINQTPNLLIHGNNVDSAVAPTTVAQVTGMVVTTASVAWDPTGWTAGTAYQTTDITAIVQEIVNRGSWSSGNNMQFRIRNNGGATSDYVQIAALEHATYAPVKLHVVYASDAPLTDPALTNTQTISVDVFLHKMTDPALAPGQSLAADTFAHILRDLALASGSVIQIDTFGQISHLTDAGLVNSSSTLADALGYVPFDLTDEALVNLGTFTVDSFGMYAIDMHPFWVWRFIRTNGNLYIIPVRSRKGWVGTDLVSEDYKYTTAYSERASRAVAAAWATNKNASTATLKAAIDVAMYAAGFRQPG